MCDSEIGHEQQEGGVTFFFFFFFQGDHTLSRKKMVRKPPHSRAGCIVEPYNASRHQNSHIYNVW